MKKLKLVSHIFILGIFLFGCTLQAQAATPTLNFSDLISGPASGLNDGLGEGVIVTIWGNNLGSTQGTSTITIGGQTPAHIYYWKNADGNLPGGPSDLYTSHQMQEIAFSIPSSLTNGEHQIQITVNGKTSNTLPFLVRDGSIYHIKTTGNSNGNGSWNNPYLQILNVRSIIIPGDIYYSHEGVADIDTYGNPAGDTGTGITLSGRTGTLENQMAFVTYPNTRALLQGTSKGLDMYNSDSVVLSKYTIRTGKHDTPLVNSTEEVLKDSGTGIEGSKNGRLIANDVSQIVGKCISGWSGAIVASCGGSDCDPISNLKVLGNYIHDWGCPQTSHFEHTTYMSIRNNGYTDVEAWEMGWNHLRDNQAKYGIHNYDETQAGGNDNCGSPIGIVKLHDNYIINQKGPGISVGSRADIGYACWDNVQFDIYNNIIIEAGKGPEYTSNHGVETPAIYIRDAGMSEVNVNIFNNTMYGFGDDASGSGAGISFVSTNNHPGGVSAEISNNIVYDTRGGVYTNIVEADFPNITGSNNDWFSTGGSLENSVDSRLSNNIFQDPKFINNTNNYQLQSISPAINSGITWLSLRDIRGILRPQGAAFDIGAYEYEEIDTIIRADVNQQNGINTTDASLTLRNSLGLNMNMTNWQPSTTTGDVNCDNTSNSTDAYLILRYSLGLGMNGTGWCVN
jgi:hypothetical protein